MSRDRLEWFSGSDALAFLDSPAASCGSSLLEPTVFNTLAWQRASARYLLNGRTLLLVVWADANAKAAWTAFTWGRESFSGVPASTLRLLGYPASDRYSLQFDAAPGNIQQLALALRVCPRNWDLAIFDELLDDDATRLEMVARMSDWPMKARRRHCASSPLLDLVGGNDAVQASYSSSLRTRLRRARKKLEQAGRAEFTRLQPSPENIDTWVDRIAVVEKASWKGLNGVGIFEPGLRQQFFRSAARELARDGYVDLGLLHLDGQLIAYRFGLRYGGRYLDYNFAHLPEFAELSPGRLLFEHLITSSTALGLKAIDASRGSIEKPHLLADWPTSRVEHYALWLRAPTVTGRVLHWLAQTARPAVRHLTARLVSDNPRQS